MDDKRRMMFILEEDYYFLTLKIITILLALKCEKKELVDYRKLGFFLEVSRNDENLKVIKRKLRKEDLNLLERERLIGIYCSSKSNESMVKRVLFFLEKKQYIGFQKSPNRTSVNIIVTKKGKNELAEFVSEEDREYKRIVSLIDVIKSARYIKYDSLLDKAFGEVRKWEE